MDIEALFDVLRTLVLVSAVWLFTTWLVALAISALVGGLVLVMLPASYLSEDVHAADRRRWWSPGRLGRLALGTVLLGLGAVLTLPGVPGQGLLTMFVGLRLVAPGWCRRLECAIGRRRSVLTNVNRLRARFRQPPLVPPRAA